VDTVRSNSLVGARRVAESVSHLDSTHSFPEFPPPWVKALVIGSGYIKSQWTKATALNIPGFLEPLLTIRVPFSGSRSD
jgi:hypothetical protein